MSSQMSKTAANGVPELSVTLRRTEQTSDATYGVLEVRLDDTDQTVFTCHTLELPWRDNQRSISCIPEGRYPVVKSFSPRFQTMLWEVKNVPGRSGIRIHAANRVQELEGCIAPGMLRYHLDNDGILDVGRSREALKLLDEAMWPRGGFTLTVTAAV